ncbi:MAG: hypothetical protein EOO39_07195 [Cytophagaceae bacterium]|nr:MAG: hypothetical protein EOO39_07195 [Cytophagaceae bacterium]
MPLKLTYDLTNQLLTPTLTVSINGVANDLVFDTGSWGMRILPGALRRANLAIDPVQLTYGYGLSRGAVFIKGRQASGTFSVGGLVATAPVHIMLIDTIRRSPTDAGRSTLDSVTVPNPHFRNLAGILGVGLRVGKDLKVASPLAQLPGNNSYLVHFPAYGQPMGSVILNPRASDLTGFTFFPLAKGTHPLPNGLDSWVDNQFNGRIVLNGVAVHAPTLLDTGSPTTHVSAPNLPGYGTLSQGSVMKMGLAQPGQLSTLIDTTFRVTSQTAGKDLVHATESSQAEANMLFGTNFFFAFDVYYDQKRGRVGIKKK